MMEKNRWVKRGVAVLPLIITCHTAVASYHSDINDGLTISSSLGLLNAESQEFVYQPQYNGRKLSQIDWKAENTPIVKMDISWDLLSRLTLTARGWSTLSPAKGVMDDYDWKTLGQSKWTDWSHHEKTNLNYANEIDLNAKFWLLKQENYRIGMMAGYQRNNNSWTSYGGNYNYNSGNNLFTGSDSVTNIGYKQKFEMPYLGLAGSYHYQKFEFNTLLKYSSWVNAYGDDEHYLRQLSFKDSSKGSRYYAVVIDAGYYVTDNTKLFVEASWNRHAEGKGDTQIIDTGAGVSANVANSAGIAQQNQTITIGLQYKF
ncbi:omptin family outer membrane protease [Yersinia sp. 1652 StPb PI]|uniref:omptin family outer membrane protease n=1 Tax=unclassified Yersinia (in: enterobacteria) TaxID=2653513 RepID=UPI00355C93D2